MENPIKMDDLGVQLFLETPIYLGMSPFPVVTKFPTYLASWIPFFWNLHGCHKKLGTGDNPKYTNPIGMLCDTVGGQNGLYIPGG